MKCKVKTSISTRIKDLILEKGLTVAEVVSYIEKHSDERLKKICRISKIRLDGIIEGLNPSFLECILIADALQVGSVTYFID
ncbi:MAG: hypothetical protein HUJ88_11595 [Fusobacterium necrophorum]|nr:hypothetical protein [Fusobacterium necrophorum]